MELGARKLDFIGEKFELADEIADQYHALYDAQGDRDFQERPRRRD